MKLKHVLGMGQKKHAVTNLKTSFFLAFIAQGDNIQVRGEEKLPVILFSSDEFYNTDLPGKTHGAHEYHKQKLYRGYESNKLL